MSLIKGGVVTVEHSVNGTDYTDIGVFLEEGFDYPKEEPAPIGLGDGTEGQAGVKLSFVIPVADADPSGAALSDCKDASDDLTLLYFRFTASDAQTVTTIPCRVSVTPTPIKAFGGVSVVMVAGNATGSAPGSTYTLA
ncbi:MAG TPA: hypothetical protein VKA63_07145 [Candidatus Krumholzibacteria bacterium]|nr:hypothetical protein [Candidatus Krumholzibacteria bacterium]